MNMSTDHSIAEKSARFAIIGAGSIGVAFAVVFGRARAQVCVYDPDGERRNAVIPEVSACLADLQAFGLLNEPPESILQRIQVTDDLTVAVANADLVQECAPEKVDLKLELFTQVEAAAPDYAVLARSSSALPATQFAPPGRGRSRCLVAHPGNPPYLIPVIEIVPSPQTEDAVVKRAFDLYRQVGLSPVRVRKEIEGFIFNRLQGAVLREAYCLVRDGIADVNDIDTVMRDGLGMRWSFMGPFETVDLNTRGGIVSHASKMGPAYERMGAQRGQHDPWTPDLVTKVDQQRRTLLSLDDWKERVRWRDRMLMRLLQSRKDSDGLSS